VIQIAAIGLSARPASVAGFFVGSTVEHGKPGKGLNLDHTHDSKALKLWTGATYRICVQGKLDKRYSDRLGGLTITLAKDDENAPVTTLYGRLLDQGALIGVLNTLYNGLHLPLLLVECVEIGKDVNAD
jgi:hypothetical protein